MNTPFVFVLFLVIWCCFFCVFFGFGVLLGMSSGVSVWVVGGMDKAEIVGR